MMLWMLCTIGSVVHVQYKMSWNTFWGSWKVLEKWQSAGIFCKQQSGNPARQVVHMCVSVIKQYKFVLAWGGATLWLGTEPLAWWKVMAAYHRFYDWVTWTLAAGTGLMSTLVLVIKYGSLPLAVRLSYLQAVCLVTVISFSAHCCDILVLEIILVLVLF